MTPTREEILKQLARDAGFSLAGIASLSPDPHANGRFADWLAAGMHGDMDYLRRHRPLREDATTLLPDARSAICVALNYYQPQEREQRDMDGSDNRGRFSIYAQSQDYHAVMDGMLADLDRRVRKAFPQVVTLACCDTRPVSDRSLAMRAGIAWLGKNTNVISPQFGSWIFLGELLTTLELTPDAPLETLCGKCTRCIDACPTGALDTPFVLDARRCISYLTIEKRGEIDADLAAKIGVDVYGCDTCQSVCPFNRVATESLVFTRDAGSPLVDMTLDELMEIPDETFREHTHDSAIRRCKPEGIRRNAKIVRENVARRDGADD
jgi:epoxyqueuosine reductase